MKFQVTNPKVWNKLSERNLPMSHKIKIYEKLGGAYRLGESGGEQVFNKMTELLKHKISEGNEKSPKEIVRGLKEMAMGDLERIEDYAEMIADRMENGQELSSWMYSQITLAVDQLNSVHDAMDGKDGEKEEVTEGSETSDHEVSMAMGQLDDIAKNVMELKGKIGSNEKNLPGWIQDHISQAQNFINQANTGYHELKSDNK
jgi:hypothetical protein